MTRGGHYKRKFVGLKLEAYWLLPRKNYAGVCGFTHRGSPTYSSILKVITCLKVNSPASWNSTNFRYTPIGEDPVGSPRTKGLSLVGANCKILSRI
jgi:hypothetical protein